VVYERSRQTQAPELLEDIQRYNEQDCRSTAQLREWLVSLRPTGATWFQRPARLDEGDDADGVAGQNDSDEPYRLALLADCAPEQKPLRELVGQLLGFHRREAKPQYWRMFDRQNQSDDELVDDVECVGALEQVGEPEPLNRSLVFTYDFPAQDTKLQVGDPVQVARNAAARRSYRAAR
jgi:hypothetical protein